MYRTACAAAALVVAATTGVWAQAQAPASSDASVAALHAKAAKSGGKVRIIVEFGTPGVAVPTQGPAAAVPAFVSALKATQSDVIATHFADGASTLSGPDRSLTRMDYVPQFAINATAAEISRLARDPRVVRVHEDKFASPTLAQSLGIVRMTGTGGAFSLPSGGAKGHGRAVAILDTGVNKNHEFLKNKVISEACYNSNVPALGASSRCPGRVTATTATGSGADCQEHVAIGCGHGTHVAGIAAGFNTSRNAGEPVSGVAPAAKIVAINVFSKVGTKVLSATSDQIKGLERVFALRNGIRVGTATFRIDAVNMSLGGGDGLRGFCDTDPLKPIIDALRRVNIATVVASGNEGFINGVTSPGCIRTAITVGSSTKGAPGQPQRMSSFTNQGPQVDTLAPGGDGFGYPFAAFTPSILSSLVSGGYGGQSGTSMATPTVAGAIAAIRSRASCRQMILTSSGQRVLRSSVARIEAALQQTGPLITDHRINPSFPQLKERRIDVVQVMKKLGCFS
jgi:serine protease